MSLVTGHEKKLFELLPEGRGGEGHVISKSRCLVGSSEACDIVISHPSVNPIHAVLEIQGNKLKLYDMHSQTGTYVNGKKIVASEFELKDTLAFGSYTFTLNNYNPEDLLPPVLEVLDPSVDKKFPVLPKTAPNRLDDDKQIPVIEYPLAKDPKAEFSEYIFEDADKIFPIFNYQANQNSVEIIILFKGIIYSVDFLPVKNGTIRLVGAGPNASDVEFAYLGKEEKIDFIEVSNGEVSVHSLFGYDCFQMSEQNDHDKTEELILPLNANDILRFAKGDLQIFVRLSEKPPKVKAAPILRREGDLRKYLLLVFLFIFTFLGIMSSIEVDEEIEKEKIPERIATILYKEKLTLSKERAVVKNKKAPKKVKMQAPKKKVVLKKEPEKKMVLKKSKKQTDRQAPKKKLVAKPKKTTPNKAKRNNRSNKVRPKKVVAKSSRRKTKRNATRARRRSNNPRKSKGNVDTFKSFDFESSVSSLIAKGGTTKSAKAATAASSDTSESTLDGADSATLKRAKVSNNIGSLSGAARGKLDASTGTSGLSNKKSIYTAGMPGKTVVFGGMDPDIIRRILRDHIPQFRYCYQSVLDRSSSHFQGVVKLNFIIGASGHVSRAGVNSVKGKMPGKVRGCVRNVLLGIKFPEPMGGGRVEVNQPISFYPKIR